MYLLNTILMLSVNTNRKRNLIQLLSVKATAQTNKIIKHFAHSNKQKNRDNYTEHGRTHHD